MNSHSKVLNQRAQKSGNYERDFPHVVEIELPPKGFETSRTREIEEFHRLKGIQRRFARGRNQDTRYFARWCFAEPNMADDFCMRFGGKRISLRNLSKDQF
jgi:hypothetical protein